MKAHHPFILFFLSSIPVHAKTSQVFVTQTEVFIWGSIFFSISLGSLLLIVHLFPKSKPYKSQFIPEDQKDIDNHSSNMNEEEINTLSTDKVTNPSTFTSITSIDSVPSFPSIKPTENEVQPVQRSEKINPVQPPVHCITIQFDSVYKMRLLDVENVCKEFIEKLNTISKTRSTSIYFIKNNLFVCYIEKKMNVFIEYDPSKEKIDFSQDIINFLYKKLGAFSSTQSDAVLPLINNSELFGAIKLQFINPVKNNEVNKIWKEIKIFSSLFYETYFSTPTIESEDEINTLSTSDFQNMLQKKFSSTGNFSLILFKVLKTKLSNNLDYRVSVILRKILKISVDVYKLNDDTYSLVITKDSFNTLEQNIGMFLGELINEDPSIEICISNAFTYPNTKNIDDWYRTALSSLKIAVSKGANKFHFVH